MEKSKTEKSNDVIGLCCKQCGYRAMNYLLQYDEEAIVLQHIEIKCNRCKRVIVFKRYTERMLRMHSKDGKFRF